MKIMFICTGNICRSAMAHVMLEKKAKEENKDIQVYSCGVFAMNGDVPTYEGIQVMKEYGIDLNNHRATHIRNSKIEDMDIILCATTSHKNNVITKIIPIISMICFPISTLFLRYIKVIFSCQHLFH